MTSQPKRRWLQFSLRGLIVLMVIAASFMGGWVANEARHRYILSDDVQIEVIDETETIMMRGTKEDLDAVAEKLSKSIESARQDGDQDQKD